MKLKELTKAPSFERELSKLIALKKDYRDLPQVVEAFFQSFHTIDDLVNATLCIQRTGGMGIHKVRIKREGTGSSGGYRLYFLIFYPKKDICLLTIYPKAGKYGMNNLAKEALKSLIKEYAEWRRES